MPTPHEAFALLTRLDVALECRAVLLEKRQTMIREFRRTGIKWDSFEFAALNDNIRINLSTIEALQATLKALGVSQ
jgi:hypothetical protein